MALQLDGDRVRIFSGSTDIGQGTDTIFPQIVAETLGIPMSRVDMVPHDTALVPDSGPTVASRTAMVVGGVTAIAARKLHEALAAGRSARTCRASCCSSPSHAHPGIPGSAPTVGCRRPL